jgi:hypothetical protein
VAFRYHMRREDFLALSSGSFICTGGFGLGCGAPDPAKFYVAKLRAGLATWP